MQRNRRSPGIGKNIDDVVVVNVDKKGKLDGSVHRELPVVVKKRILDRTLEQELSSRKIGKGAYPLPIIVATEVTEVTMESTWQERINAK